MASRKDDDIVQHAERIYEERLRAKLEKSHPNAFVAIEPVSGDYFLGETLSEAGIAARKAHPDRLSFIMRVGHRTAVHIGVCDDRNRG